MRKKFLRVLMAVTMGISLGGCAAMKSGEWCGRQQVKETPPPPAVEKTYTPPPPAPKPAPPKPDRN